jgi:RNA polymerase sigma-70 factor (ECF subfamily)
MRHERDAIDPAEVELGRLMSAYLDGRLDAFDALYASLAPRLRSYFLAMCRNGALADDLVQDTFMQIHRSRRTFEVGRPVTPWAFAIARHVFLMHRRRTARRLRFEDSLAADLAGSDVVHDTAQALVDRDRIERALERVPADQRRALLMHHVQGWSFAEIASRLNIRVNAAKTRAFRGVRKLKEQLRGSQG